MMDNEQLPKGYKNTEVGVIPEDWDVKRLGEIATIIGGGTPSTNETSFWNGNINWFTPTEIGLKKYSDESVRKITKIGLENSSARLLPVGTILLTTRAGIGDISILMSEACTNQGFQSFVVNDGFDNEYIYYLISTLKNTFIQNASGSTFLEISPKKIKAIQIAIPTKSEQTAIANALSDTDALINSLEKLIAKKRNIKQGAMQQLLKPKEGWEVKKLGEIAEVRDGTHQTPTYVDSGIPFYSVESVTNNDFRNTKYITEEAHKLLTKTCKIEKGDILMTRIGSIGDCKLIDWDVNASFYVSLALLKIKSGYSSEYIYHYSKTAYFKKEADINSLQSAIPKKINLGPISNIKIEMPEYDEQIRIATILSDMDTEIQALETKLDKYRNIKLGMMQNLLTGKIRLV